MKLILLGDTHLGIRDDDQWIQDYQRDFFDFMFGYMKDHDIKTVLQLGDWFDVRRGVTQETLMFQRTYLNDKLTSNGNETHILVGNHDMHLREFIVPNTPFEVLSTVDGVNIYEKPTTVKFGDVAIDVIPWICKDNQEEVLEFIENTTSEYCVGHFELNGYLLSAGQVASGHTDASFLKKYKQVWSGHFHTQSKSGNVQYLGTPYTLTMADANEDRGFHVFDTETEELEFIANPTCHHVKVYYDAATFDMKSIAALKDKAVKVVVERRSADGVDIDFGLVEQRIADVAHSLQIIDEIEIVSDVATDVKDVKDVTDYVYEHVDTLDESDDVKARIKAMFNGLYAEALEVQR